jgi:hypothetical protein
MLVSFTIYSMPTYAGMLEKNSPYKNHYLVITIHIFLQHPSLKVVSLFVRNKTTSQWICSRHITTMRLIKVSLPRNVKKLFLICFGEAQKMHEWRRCVFYCRRQKVYGL